MTAEPAPAASRTRALWVMIADIAAPIAVYYVLRAAGASVWLALAVGAIIPAVTATAGLLRRRRADMMGLLALATLAASAALSLATGSPRALLARDALITAAWAGYLYLSLLASRPATFVVSRPLLEGRRVYDPATRGWVRPAARSWDELWQGLPRFRRIWRACTLIWGTAILVDAIIRVIMAYTLPVGLVPGLGGALWPVTFIALQVVTNVYFYRSGFWRILRDGRDGAATLRHWRRHELGDGAGHRGRVVDHDPRPGAGDGNQRGVGKIGGEPAGVRHREEAAFLSPDQQHRPVEPRDLRGRVEEELRAEPAHGRDEIAEYPPVTQRRSHDRLRALRVQVARGDAGLSPAPDG
jgi:hypothetical protein